MGNKEKLYDQIECYLDNQRQGNPSKTFTRRLSKCPGLKGEIQLHRAIKEAILDSETSAFRELVHLTIQKNKRSTGSPRTVNLIAAASVIFILMFSLIAFQHYFTKEQTPELIAHQYFEPYDNIMFNRSDESLASAFNGGMSAYQKGDYFTAIALLKQVPHIHTNRKTANFYIGIAHQAMGEYDHAIQFLSRLTEDKGGSLSALARWYLSLALLQKGEVENGKKLLTDIARNGNLFHQNLATQILEQL